MAIDLNHPIVLFDGVCNYCNAMVNFAIRNDKQAKLRFAPMQSAIGVQLKKQFRIAENIDSIVFINNSKAYTHADAVFRIANYLSYPAKAVYALRFIPLFISNAAYKWVAKNRYKWFGKKEVCMIPSAALKARFLE